MKAIVTSLLILMPAGNPPAVEDAGFLEDADAYYDYEHRRCEIKGGKALLNVRLKKTILNSRGDMHSDISIHEDRYSRIKSLELKLLDAAGNVVLKEKKKDLRKACGFGPNYQLYRDICYYYREVAYPGHPYSVELEYEMEIKSLFFWRGTQFQHYIPVKSASYKLICPPDFRFHYKTYGLDIEPLQTRESGKYVFTWQAENIPALEEHHYLPDGYPDAGMILVVADNFVLEKYGFKQTSWQNIGRWYQRLAADMYLQRDTARELNAVMTDSLLAAVKSVYEELVENVRYVSVSIGIGGWKPHMASLTKERGYGDCKDMSTLLISRLRNLGLESFPVLAVTRGEGLIDPRFPNFNFNHVFIVAVAGEDTLWMDPTCNNCRFGDLPWRDEDIMVLIVTDTSGVMVRSPRSKPADNRSVRNSSVFIDRDGNVSFSSRLTYYGNCSHGRKSRLAHLDEDETGTFVRSLLPGGTRRYEVLDYSIRNIGEVDAPLEINITARRKKPIDELNRVLYFDPNILETLTTFESLDIGGRTVPVDLGYPILKEHNITITWDSSLAFDSITVPPDDSVGFSFGDMSCRFSLGRETVGVNLSRSYCGYEIPVEEFEDFGEYRDRIKEVTSRYIKFYKASD